MGVVGRTLKWSLIERDVECINLAQDRQNKQDVIQMAVTLWVSSHTVQSSLAVEVVASQGRDSTELVQMWRHSLQTPHLTECNLILLTSIVNTEAVKSSETLGTT